MQPAPPASRVLLDGALGTLLGARGVDTQGPLFSSAALLTPEGRALLSQAHLDYARAGAQVLTAASFRTSRRSLARAGLGDRFRAVAAEAIRLAVEAASRFAEEERARDPGAAGLRPRVAGSLAPLEDCYRPWRAPRFAEARREHAEHAAVLAEAGCELLLVETVCSAHEGLAAVEAAAETGLPVWVAAMATPHRTLLDGVGLSEFFRDAVSAGAQAALINCTPCAGIDAALDDAAAAGVPFGAYAHLGPVDPACGWPSGPVLAPDEYRTRALAWRARGAAIVGGCCGTTPAHIAALRG